MYTFFFIDNKCECWTTRKHDTQIVEKEILLQNLG